MQEVLDWENQEYRRELYREKSVSSLRNCNFSSETYNMFESKVKFKNCLKEVNLIGNNKLVVNYTKEDIRKILDYYDLEKYHKRFLEEEINGRAFILLEKDEVL